MMTTNIDILQAHEERRKQEKHMKTQENFFVNTKASMETPWAASPASTSNMN